MPRLDQLLVQRGLAPTRSAAQRLIEHGGVEWRVDAAGAWGLPRKAGLEVTDAAEVRLVDNAELRWASRAGLKLEAALAATGLTVRGRRALDLGQGTGGFTDVLLAQGAARVTGVEVGHSQLVARLREMPRVTLHERTDARDFLARTRARFGLVVGDLAFMSQTLVLPGIRRVLAPEAEVLMLVKPQFELQPADIGRGGLVRDAEGAARRVEARLRAAYAEADLAVLAWLPSPVLGGDGNREFFIHARPLSTAA